MNFIILSKYLLLFTILFLISCKSIEKNINKNFNNQTNIPEILNYENEEAININSYNFESNFKKKFYLENYKNSKNIQSKLKTFFLDGKFYTFNSQSELFVNDSINGKLLHKNQFIDDVNNDILISNYFKNNYFILAYTSGKVVKTDLNGNIIWKFKNEKLFNSFIYEINDIIFILYGDEIVALDFKDGKQLWSEIYEDKPIIQAKGGQVNNFFNDVYFILPNGRLGSLDLLLGSKNDNKFVNLELQNSINNANDKIYLFKNFIVYLDEGEFLYTYNLLTEEFLLYNFKINYSASNYFFNNSIIIKNNNYLEAINILNGKTFWLIDSKLNEESKILNIKKINQDLTILLNNGEIAIVEKNNIREILNLKLKKIKSFHFLSNNQIVYKLENGKIGIF